MDRRSEREKDLMKTRKREKGLRDPSRRQLLQTALAAAPWVSVLDQPAFALAAASGADMRVDDSLLNLGAREAVTHIANGNIKAEAYAARLLKHYHANKDLNTVVSMDESRMLAEARAIDIARDKGQKLGSLAGLPVLIKDQANVAGYPTTAGNGFMKSYIAKKNAVVVDKLVQNGAVVFAKGNCAVVIGAIQGTGATSTNPYLGFVRNPYDKAYIPGGSSGGNGAALAARIVPAALGADAGGSVRGPSSCCGVAGLRPSTYTIENFLNNTARKRYSTEGELPPPTLVDTFGPMARTVSDIAFLDEVITGEQARMVELKGIRIGVPRGDYWDLDVVEPEVATITRAALEKLKAAGAELVEYDLNAILALNDGGGLNAAMRRPNNDLAEWLAVNAPDIQMSDLNAYRDSYPRLVLPKSKEMSDVEKRQFVTSAMNKYQDPFRSHNLTAIAYPTLPIRPPLINCNGDTPYQKILIKGKWLEEHASIAYNLTIAPALGVPALSLPCGMNQGLPVGLSLQGVAGDDAKLLGLGISVEKVFGSIPPPKMQYSA